jgi:hypothetical protein
MLSDRIFALVVLIATTVVPIQALSVVVVPEVQLILGTLVVLYLLLRDPIAGLLLGLALLLAYFRVFRAKYGVAWNPLRSTNYPMSSLVTDYITPEHLHDAQSNVVDERDYAVEIKGVKGVYGEDVYGAQGLDAKLLPGYGEIPPGEMVPT